MKPTIARNNMILKLSDLIVLGRRTTPFFPMKMPAAAPLTITLMQRSNNIVFPRLYSSPFFDQVREKDTKQPCLDLDKQRKELINVLQKGIRLIFDHSPNISPNKKPLNFFKRGVRFIFDPFKSPPHSSSLLCLQVILALHHDDVNRDFPGMAGLTVVDPTKPSTYQLQTQAAIGQLRYYSACWLHSLSMVLTDRNSNWQEKVSSSDLKGRRVKYRDDQPNMHTEITLFLLADYVIDDKEIGNREDLKKFLDELIIKKSKLQRVHVSYSSISYDQENQSDYHHVII